MIDAVKTKIREYLASKKFEICTCSWNLDYCRKLGEVLIIYGSHIYMSSLIQFIYTNA